MVIIEEQNLSSSGSCTHNCNLNDINDTINYGECKEYRDCQYINSDYEICESVIIIYIFIIILLLNFKVHAVQVIKIMNSVRTRL